MAVNQAGIDLIKEFEGFRAETYLDPVGIPTIGYGTTAAADVGIVPKPGMTITQDDAEVYMRRAVTRFAEIIEPHIKLPINANQFAAFVSLAYNIGPAAFLRSTALKRFNADDPNGASLAMLWWNKAGGKVIKGLVRRREAERALFLTPVKDAPESAADALLRRIQNDIREHFGE